MTSLKHPSSHRSWVEIDLSAIRDNTAWFKSLVGPNRLVMPAVKGDGYGHGAVEVAKACLEGGADRLAVATCREGQELREAGIGVPIQILGAILPEEVKPAVLYNLTISLHCIDIARLVAIEAVTHDKILPIQFKIDSGMGRLGILPEDAVAAAREIFELPNLRFDGVFMHFAEAADHAYSHWQLDRFNTGCRLLEEAGITGFQRHAANSAGTIQMPEAWYDMIRPGAGVYGAIAPAWTKNGARIRQAMSWKSAIIQLKDYPPGQNLGYNRTYTTRKPTRVAVLPTGYADGYRREFSNKAEVLIRGKRAKVIGMISMDYAMADVTDFDDLEVGTVATLLGRDGDDMIRTEQLAEWGDTIPYCIITGIGRRVERLYIHG